MSLDEAALREWVHRVVHGLANRRAFLRYMMGLGLSGPFLSHLLATSTPARAQTPRPAADFVPTKRGGGGKLRLLWWQAPTILNTHLAAGGKDLDASRVVYEPLAAFDPDANFGHCSADSEIAIDGADDRFYTTGPNLLLLRGAHHVRTG